VQADAVRWVASDATAPFSFRWTCESLGLDYVRVRRALAARAAA
jgi:hypothetical protein